MDLFAEQREAALQAVHPLAVRLRPRTLDEFVGQEHFAGSGRQLRRMLEADRLTSAILYGPPGCGKTTLARLIAGHTQAEFVQLHAAEAGVKDVRQVIDAARERLLGGQRTVLFLDEIHRFNRAQQDVLLKDVEEGVLILIGATTENPFFTVNSPLISRSQIFEFKPLTPEEIEVLLRRALADTERGLGKLNVTCDNDALRFFAERADGDARRALNALEVAALSQRVAQPPSAENFAQPSSVEHSAKPARLRYCRNLPHIHPNGRPVFITFCTANRWILPEPVRGAVLEHCLHDHGKKLFVHGVVVMPDHVHMVCTPLEDGQGQPYGLAELLNGIKGASAHTVNRLLKRRGSVWQPESFDRVLRTDEKMEEKVAYLCANPVRKGLVADEEKYPWIWREWIEGTQMRGGESGEQGSAQSGATEPGSQPRAAELHISLEVAAESMQLKAVPYDASGDAHYDIASAFIKSMRGSDPDATLYWLARMLEGGEDPRFIARRIAIAASEDVGNADPQAAMLAAAAIQITQTVGLPECEYALAQAAVYNALAPKSNAVTKAIAAAKLDVRAGVTLPVPEHLRDASYRGAARLGHGQDYQYPHDDPSGYVTQDYLGTAKSYYNPTQRGVEGQLAAAWRALRQRHAQGPVDEQKT